MDKCILALVGRLGYTPMQGITANVYLPRRFAEYLALKPAQRVKPPPEGLLILTGGFYVLRIKREQK